MDSHEWQELYRTIRAITKRMPRRGRKPRFSDALILGMYFWSVRHDRPLCWACVRKHYSSLFRPRRLPSVSQFCKRVNEPRFAELLQAVHEALAPVDSPQPLSYLDGKALPVGPHSKDRDARAGRTSGGYARGYRLHAWAGEDGRIPLWAVTALNVNEKRAAAELLKHRPAESLVLADGEYDSAALYDNVDASGGQLLTPLPTNAGRGHRRQSPARLRAIEMWRGIAGYVYKERWAIERTFAHLTSFGGGLGPLPAWVRTLTRVRRWVGAKIIIYHIRLRLRNSLKANAS